MSGRAIYFVIFGIFLIFLIARYAMFYFEISGLEKLKKKPAPAPAPAKPEPVLTIIPRIPEYVRESDVPKVPSYLVGPFIFVDARLGIAMLAGYPVRTKAGEPATAIEPWIFRLHGDNWCTVRKAGDDDLEPIANLKRYARPLLLMRAQ